MPECEATNYSQREGIARSYLSAAMRGEQALSHHVRDAAIAQRTDNAIRSFNTDDMLTFACAVGDQTLLVDVAADGRHHGQMCTHI